MGPIAHITLHGESADPAAVREHADAILSLAFTMLWLKLARDGLVDPVPFDQIELA